MKSENRALRWGMGIALAGAALFAVIRFLLPATSLPEVVAHVRVDSTTRLQVITGWEATAQAGEEDASSFPIFRDTLFDLAVNDLGITRLRLWLRSGFERRVDVWQEVRAGRQEEFRCSRFHTENDNDDPFTIDSTGFHFSQLDHSIEEIVLPMKRRLEARGEKLFINANYAAFVGQCTSGYYYHHEPPEEYAEYVLASYLHMRNKYGLVPDAWEVILEPENTEFWRGRQIGEAIIATARRLEQHGFTPRFIAPSNTRAANAVRYFDEMIQVPGVLDYLEEFSYHRYRRLASADIEAIGARAARHGVKTSMLEHIASGYEDLHEDLKVGRASAWQQFALAYPAKADNGAQYYMIEGKDSRRPRIRLAERSRYLRQYFHYVRPGAVRIGAHSNVAAVDPLAFTGPNDKSVVVIKTDRAARITVSGLRAGLYSAVYTTEKGTRTAAERVAVKEAPFEVSMPASGVITIFRLHKP